jgi:hypothetical protein
LVFRDRAVQFPDREVAVRVVKNFVASLFHLEGRRIAADTAAATVNLWLRAPNRRRAGDRVTIP